PRGLERPDARPARERGIGEEAMHRGQTEERLRSDRAGREELPRALDAPAPEPTLREAAGGNARRERHGAGPRQGFVGPFGRMAPERPAEPPAERGLDLTIQKTGDLEAIVGPVGLVADKRRKPGAERASSGQPRLGRVAEGEVESDEHPAGLLGEPRPDESLRLGPRPEVARLLTPGRLAGSSARDPASVGLRPDRAPRRGGRPVRDDDQPEAQGVRTILPNCRPSARRRCASTPSRSGITVSTMARRRPAKSWPMTVLNSASFDIVEPMIESCFQNTRRMSVSAIGPEVAPQVTMRPPLATVRIAPFQVAAPTFSRITSTPRRPVFWPITFTQSSFA